MRKILRGHLFYKKFLFTLCLGFSFFVEAQAQVSGTYTINSAVATGGSNFNSFSAAVAFLSSGVNGAVVFNVQSGSGPYNEQVIINNISGTSATNTITFNCNAVTLTFLSTNSNQRAGIKLNNTDYVTFDNLTVLPQAATAGQYGYGFHLLNDADHNIIRNCRITNNVDWNNTDNHEGVVINGSNANSYDEGYSNCDDNLIQNNTISGGSVGITLSSIPPSGNSAQFMTGNKVVNNTISNTIYYGLQMYYTSGTLIDGNEITGGPDAVYDLTGMYFGYLNQSFAVTNNRIHAFHCLSGSTLYGILISSESVAGKENLVANNLIYDFQCDGSLYGIASRFPDFTYSTSYLNIYHNTISLDDQIVSGAEAFGIYLQTVSDVNVVDNIVTVTHKSTDRNYGIYFQTIPVRFASQRNVFYVPPSPALVDAIGVYGGTAYITMAAWQTATGFDYYSTDVNPLYTNLTGFNFRPTAQAIDNMAAYLNINTDITGAARNITNPDVGCYEFTSTSCSSSITAGTVNVLPDSILCVGPKISLGLSGYSAGGGQTYTWQTSTTPTGTYTNISSPLGYPYLETVPTATYFYRVALTCGTTTAYSKPIRVLINTTLNGGTYTINPELPTGGINFNSFRDATLALQCGINGSIVFNVASGSGPYSEQLIIPVIATSPTRTVTFNCNGVTLAYAPSNTEQSAVVKLNGADYVTIDSLNVDVQGTSGFGFGIQLINNADHNSIKRCTVNLNKTSTSRYYAGIVMNSSYDDPIYWVLNSNNDSNLIANNTVKGGYYGITCTSNSLSPGFSTSIGNVIRKNTIADTYGYGVYLSGTASTLVDSNDISQPTRTVLTGFTGIYAFQINFGLTLSKNKIHNLSDKFKTSIVQLEGIKFENVSALSTAPNMVTNNLIYYFKGNGLQYGINTISSSHLKFYHNTISLDDSTSTFTAHTRGFGSFGTPSPGVELKNNIFVLRRGGTGDKFCVYTNINDSGLVANYNNYYISSYGGSSYIGQMGAARYATLPNWLATRKDSSSISIDPVFNDLENGDLTPTKIPFENRGLNVGVTNDIWDVTRSTTSPDIGAIEFTICRPLTAPVLSLESAGANTVTFSWPAIQYTTGYRVSRDGITWTNPSSGAMGTTHTITGLHPRDSVKLTVKALGARADCPEYFSQQVGGQALADQVYIPNTFTPNGDSHNDVFMVYSNVLASVRWMVFNQWGEKVFETSDKQGSWDGNYKGKPQPVGVYIYMVSGALSDGTKVTHKGSFNLIR